MFEKFNQLFEDPATIICVKASAISLFIGEAITGIVLSVPVEHIPPIYTEAAVLISRVVAIATGVVSFLLVLKKLKSKQ